MDKGRGVGWRSALMAPVCFLIRSSVRRRRGRDGGWSDGGQKEKQEDRKRTDIQTDRIKPAEERERKRIRKRRD